MHALHCMQLRQIDNLLINDMVLYYFLLLQLYLFWKMHIVKYCIPFVLRINYAYQPISIFNFWKLKEKINVLRKVETYITERYEMGGQGGQLLTQPCFGISVNPISTRGGRLCQPPHSTPLLLAHPGHPSARDQNGWLLEQVGKKDLLKWIPSCYTSD